MANTNAPNGFRPVRHLTGGVVRANEYPIASGTGADIFAGDIVKLLDTGLLTVAAATDVNLIGVFQGVQWIDTDGTVRFEKKWPSGQVTRGAENAKAFVFDDPATVFEAQCTTGTSFTQSMVGNNADITATAGNTSTNISKHSIAISGAAAASAQIRILGLAGNSELGDAARVECIINEHLLRSTSGI